MPLIPRINGQNIALVAVTAGLVALLTWPPEFVLTAGVPITLQTLGVVLAGLLLGAWRGFAAVLLYVLAGLAGAPIFANAGAGWGTFSGYTGGFIWSFPIAAFLVGWAIERVRARRDDAGFADYFTAGLASIPVVYAIGVPWLAHILDLPVFSAGEEGGSTAIGAAMLPFVAFDILKIGIAVLAAIYVHRAFPQLLAPVEPTFVVAEESKKASTPAGTKAAAASKTAAKKTASKKAPAKAGSKK